MELLVIWVVLGLIAAAIAMNKGRSGCGFFALGVLLGPFGILWALLAKQDQAALDTKAEKTGEMKKCPACAELVRAEAIKCRHCGEALPTPTITSTATAPRPYHCLTCGRSLSGSMLDTRFIGAQSYCVPCWQVARQA